MSLQNVERIEAQTQHEQKWYQRFNKRFIAPAVAFAVTAPAYAEAPAIPDFLEPAKTGLSGIAVALGAVFTIVIGIVLLIAVFSNSKGGLKRAG